MNNLQNKTVFITGASSGIGKACAETFTPGRAKLLLRARRLDRLEEFKKELIEKYSCEVYVFELDVRNREQDEQLKNINDNQVDNSLIVYNDDFNTFDWVIECLVEICRHDETQAEQCALMIHFKGKYAVKHGDKNVLMTMKDHLIERGLTAAVE